MNMRRMIAAILGGTLALWLLQGDSDAQPVPCPGYVLASDTLTLATMDGSESYYNVGQFTITVPPKGNAALTLRQFLGQDVEIVLRVREPRKPQQRIAR